MRALSYPQVEAIRRRFNTLNPYAAGTVSYLLKTELTGWCLAISAKRYAICKTERWEHIDRLTRVKVSQHGLGRYLDPTNTHEGRRDEQGQPVWILQAWLWIAKASTDPQTPTPSWSQLPAVSRITVSSTAL